MGLNEEERLDGLDMNEPLLAPQEEGGGGLFEGVELEQVTPRAHVDTSGRAAFVDHPLQNVSGYPVSDNYTGYQAYPVPPMVEPAPEKRVPSNVVHIMAPQGIMHMPDLPDALLEWRQARPLLSVWLAMSVLMVVLGPFYPPGMLSGLLGIVAASMHLCKCCQGDASLAAPVKTTFVLATITGVLDAVVCVQMFMQFFVGCQMEEREARNEGIVIEEDAYEESADNGCSALMMVLTSILVWYSAHCFLSVRIAARARKVRDLLDPITSGMLVL